MATPINHNHRYRRLNRRCRDYGLNSPRSRRGLSLKIKRNHVGAGFPRPIASITDPGGENPPLRWIAWLRLIFKDHKRRARLNRRSAAEDAMSKNTRKVSEP